ncbi:Nif3-like dinuclear metal center hexameric protein [Paucibacter sp. DJ1R-11]|uniref:Nif3-like dinuclear metal center hexameric protein n=1 Tax=Paucibacter sp. DJ1R-11 TaxID=2893556 RepID=UPI0021E452C1|nr:Nif3-like dinuclear metal center hexameric protein [Paucibacter sp. DJ1R-11]MCV2363226.1 Nif3-like dinuclear metal center hexameric protein [Paucibacter sp. DJ1R-11]
MTSRHSLERHLHMELNVDRFKDYGPNGLQVEGRAEVRHLVCGVTASLALIEAAIEAGADAILVHHGLFWRGQDGRITGWMKQRLARLLAADVNLLAYHLPLDAHAEHGNNAQLGRVLGWQADGRFGEQDLGFVGQLPQPQSLQQLGSEIEQGLGRTPVLAPGDGRELRRAAWCTGGAQGYFEAAIAAGVDVFVTGEISEPQAHLAAETGVAFIAAGHHATERYGVQALGRHLADRFGVSQQFIDLPNPA